MKLGLINYEGDCLRAEKSKDGKVPVYDQYGELVELYDNSNQLLEFIVGGEPIIDSEGKEWRWDEHPMEAKPSTAKLLHFITGIPTDALNENKQFPADDILDDAAEDFLCNYEGGIDWSDLKYIFKQGAEYVKKEMGL